MFKFCTLMIALRLLGGLPISALYCLAEIAGQIAYFVNRSGRAAVLGNLRQVAPHLSGRQRERVARRIFVNVTRFYADFLKAPSSKPQDLKRRVGFQNLDRLMAAYREGNGVVLASFHYGSPEIAFHLVRQLGLPAVALTERLQPPQLCDLVHGLRNTHAPIFVPVSLVTMKKAVRSLRTGGVVAIMADRDIQGHGICVEFCGAPARMPAGAIELALKTGATVLPIITRRTPDLHIVIDVCERLPLIRTGDKRADIGSNISRLLEVFKHQLVHDPAQWLVLQPVWGNCSHSPAHANGHRVRIHSCQYQP
jgi:KDO2-lipid IV(A) lauroyltransferase